MAGHEVVSVFVAFFWALKNTVCLTSVFSRPTNPKQLWRYLSKLSNESSSIQWCYNWYYTISVRHGFANEVTKLLRSFEARGAWNHCGLVASGVLAFGMWSHLSESDTDYRLGPHCSQDTCDWGSLHWHYFYSRLNIIPYYNTHNMIYSSDI